MYINLPLKLIAIIVFICCCSSTSYAPPKHESFDGTYAFTALGEDFEINICTNDKDESYMSINAINADNLAHANYVFGAFRDLHVAQEIECGVFVLYFEGFQMLPPLSNGFEPMKYKFTVDTNSYQHQYSLSRAMGNEAFVLEKISMVPLTNCFEPGDYSAITFPAIYRSVDLVGSGLCPTDPESCWEIQSISDAALTDACWAHVDDQNMAHRGGKFTSLSLEWGGLLSLEAWTDDSVPTGGVCPSGVQMIIADPTNPSNIIIQSWQCEEAHKGYVYELTKVGGDAPCPLYNPPKPYH